MDAQPDPSSEVRGVQDQLPTSALQTQHQTQGTHPCLAQGCADFHMWDEKTRKDVSRGKEGTRNIPALSGSASTREHQDRIKVSCKGGEETALLLFG